MCAGKVCIFNFWHILAPGLLLRLFSYWYEMDVVDEEAFLGWKEDISQEYPGKGDALFQVGWGLTSVESIGWRDQLMADELPLSTVFSLWDLSHSVTELPTSSPHPPSLLPPLFHLLIPQVNQWLVLLAEADEEGSSSEAEED